MNAVASFTKKALGRLDTDAEGVPNESRLAGASHLAPRYPHLRTNPLGGTRWLNDGTTKPEHLIDATEITGNCKTRCKHR